MKALAFFGGLLISFGLTGATMAIVGPIAEKRPVLGLLALAAGIGLLMGALIGYGLLVGASH